MDIDDAQDELTSIDYRCPSCGSIQSDDFEVLASDETHLLNCGSCGHHICLLLHECARCGDESALSWTAVPASEKLRQLACGKCGLAWIGDEGGFRSVD